MYNTRLLGLFAPIFYLNCEHVLFVYILKQKQTKKFVDFIRKPSLGSRDVPQKIWARSVQPFIGHKQTNIKTNKQTDRQAKFIYRLSKGKTNITTKWVFVFAGKIFFIAFNSWSGTCQPVKYYKHIESTL